VLARDVVDRAEPLLHAPQLAGIDVQPPPVVAQRAAGFVKLDRSGRKYSVTNRRVSVEYGIISKQSTELRIQDIRSINLTTSGIAGLLAEHGLRFIGFLLEPHVAHRYTQRFSDDASRTDLAHWQAFETEFPDTFAGMYRFWVQRPA